MQEKLRRMREQRSQDDNGFTLIELLVVVVIIGILIAIAIPLYLNYEKGAQNKSAASDLRGAISTVEQCYSDSAAQTYPTGPTAAQTASFAPAGCSTPSATINLSSGNSMVYNPKSATDFSAYSIATYHGTNGVWYCYSSAVGGSVKTETGAIQTGYQATCP